jgi:adenylate cyclase class IV
MANSEALFEVEIRCHFDSPEEAYKVLPFMRSCLRREVAWVTRYYGLTLFRSGQLLRVSELVHHGEVKHYLGWKGPDIGGFANIRQEVDEEITAGLVNSAIMRRLGAKEEIGAADEVGGELERLGHRQFMSFGGSDQTGYEGQLGLNVKLMTCPVLRWPLLVELEKTANTEEEATQYELELHELSTKFQLQSRLVREEPPSLLYAGLFPH